MDLIKAFQKDDELLEDIRRSVGDESQFNLWWLGQSGFLLKYQDTFVLLDPYLSDSLTTKYADTDKPHIRMSELVIDPARLDFIDVVTTSHNHTDHLDGDTLKPLIKSNPGITMIGPEANRSFIADRIGEEQGFLTGLSQGERTVVSGIEFNGIPAAHNDIDKDENGNCKFMGYVLRFGPWTLYHSGDTLWHVDILNALSVFKIDIAILPINGNKPERRVAGNLDYIEAVQLGKLLRIDTIIPCHYDMFTFNTEDVSNFKNTAITKGQGHAIFDHGEGKQFSKN